MKVIGCKVSNDINIKIKRIIEYENITKSDFLHEAIDYYLNFKETQVNQPLTILEPVNEYIDIHERVDALLGLYFEG